MAARRYELTDTQWDRIKDLIPQAKTGRPPKDDRMMLNAMLWLARSGAAWADIPARFGPHQTVYEKRVVLCVLVQVRLNALEECRAVPGGLDLAHTGDLLKFAHGGWLLFLPCPPAWRWKIPRTPEFPPFSPVPAAVLSARRTAGRRPR